MGVQLIVLITRWEVVDDLDVTLALRLDLLVQHKEAGRLLSLLLTSGCRRKPCTE
jgi:hypothetical protein